METAKTVRALTREVAAGPWSILALREYASSPLFRNAVYLWTNTIVLTASGFVFWTAAAHLYPADAVGYAASAIVAMALIAQFANLGLGLGVIRFLPERQHSGATLINSVLLVTAALGLVASLIFLLGLELWSPSLRVIQQHPVFAATFLVGATAFSLSTVVDQVLVATRTARMVLIKNLGLSFSRVALVVVFASFFASFGIVAAQGFAGAALVGLSLFYLLPLALHGYRPSLQWRPKEVSSILSFSMGNYVGTLLLVAPGHILTIIVLNTAGPESAAYFYVAWTIAYAVSSFATSLSLSLFAEGSRTPGELRQMALKALFSGSLVALVAALVLLVIAEPVMHVFGSDYAQNGSTLLRILSIAAVPYVVVNIYIGAARVEKRVGSIVLATGVMAVTSLVVASVLSVPMGLEGVGLGWLTGQGVALIVIGVLVRLRHRGNVEVNA